MQVDELPDSVRQSSCHRMFALRPRALSGCARDGKRDEAAAAGIPRHSNDHRRAVLQGAARQQFDAVLGAADLILAARVCLDAEAGEIPEVVIGKADDLSDDQGTFRISVGLRPALEVLIVSPSRLLPITVTGCAYPMWVTAHAGYPVGQLVNISAEDGIPSTFDWNGLLYPPEDGERSHLSSQQRLLRAYRNRQGKNTYAPAPEDLPPVLV